MVPVKRLLLGLEVTSGSIGVAVDFQSVELVP